MSRLEKPGKSKAQPKLVGARAPKKRSSISARIQADSVKANDDAAFGPDLIVLNADLRIGTAKELYTGLANADGDGELVLVADKVARVDAAGIQALLAALIETSASGRGWRWHNPSSVLVQGIELLGLKSHLRLQ